MSKITFEIMFHGKFSGWKINFEEKKALLTLCFKDIP